MMNSKFKKIWFDFTNTPHVHFLKPFIKRFSINGMVIISARDFAETVELARRLLNREPLIVGKYGGNSKAKKAYNILARLIEMSVKIPAFDFVLSCGGAEASLVAKIRRKIAIAFDDNDISPNWMYSRFVDYAFFPKAISIELLLKQGFKPSSIYQYNGYKEDMYIADYEPDENFCKALPFKEYVVVRPENLMANYMNRDCRSIVPELLRMLVRKGNNVLYLPRYNEDRYYAQNLKGVYIPPHPVNGLDAAYFARAVLSGAGTLTREAACLGTPAVSFYAGESLLAVDRQMIQDGWIFHSRNVVEILNYLKDAKSRNVSLECSKSVQKEVFGKLDEILMDQLNPY